MKVIQGELDFDVKRQKTFTLDDVEIDLGLELNVTFIDNQKDLMKGIQWLHFAPKYIGVDIETTGLDCHENDMVMFQFGDEHRQFWTGDPYRQQRWRFREDLQHRA